MIQNLNIACSGDTLKIVFKKGKGDENPCKQKAFQSMLIKENH